MRLPTRRRWLMALLLALCVSALSLDLALRSSIDRQLPRAVPALLRVRHSRDLNFLQRPDALDASVERPALVRSPQHKMEAALALTDSVWPGRRPQDVRGLVLPLDEADAALGASLLLNLRDLGRGAAAAPVELAHCGEAVPRAVRLAFAAFFPLGPVRFHDVCAAAGRSALFPRQDGGRVALRGRALRLAAVALSEFDELLLLDAAALFFRDPTPLFDDAGYRATGALFFPAARRAHDASAGRFDSTLAVWNKRAQRQATAALAVLLADGAALSVDGGSSELLAAASERSGEGFAVSRLDAGVVGFIVETNTSTAANASSRAAVSLCGALAQFIVPPAVSPQRLRSTLPVSKSVRRARPLFVGGRSVLDAVVGPQPPPLIVYTTRNVSVESLALERSGDGDECAAIGSSSRADVAALTKQELSRVALRRQQHQHVVDWTRSVADWSVQEAARDEGGDRQLEDVVRARVAQLVASEEQLVYSLDRLAQRSSRPRGIVLPLYDKIAVLGVSLVLELRALGVDLPVEIAHCGDLSPAIVRAFASMLDADGPVRFYDACTAATRERSALFPSRPLFCRHLGECHRKFRGFDIKVLALVLSEFEEVLLLDADTLFFTSPAALFDTRKFRETGTLFFHDRISGEQAFMGQRLGRDARQTVFHDYMLSADVARLAVVPTLARELTAAATLTGVVPAGVLLPNPEDLPFAPSDFLLGSHTWNARAGFQMDSSCVLWSKRRQPRATAALASFVARNDVRAPPSYGDKELFFVACELAEARYAFSNFGIGAVGTYMIDNGPDRSVVCGDMSHNAPEWTPDGVHDHAPLLYINSDSILLFQPDNKTVFYSKPRPAELYPGPFPWQQECPFNVTAVPFSAAERARVYQRQQLHRDALDWLAARFSPPS